jgi:hypothetical protein
MPLPPLPPILVSPFLPPAPRPSSADNDDDDDDDDDDDTDTNSGDQQEVETPGLLDFLKALLAGFGLGGGSDDDDEGASGGAGAWPFEAGVGPVIVAGLPAPAVPSGEAGVGEGPV